MYTKLIDSTIKKTSHNPLKERRKLMFEMKQEKVVGPRHKVQHTMTSDAVLTLHY